MLYFAKSIWHMKHKTILTVLSLGLLSSCDPMEYYPIRPAEETTYVSVEEVARLLSAIPLESGHLQEVHDAAGSSAANGYDEEYRMAELFSAPGTGVGAASPSKADAYAHPLRDALREAFFSTKAPGGEDPAWLDSLALSDVQIYWPYAEDWDGIQQPVITYDPGEGALENEGFLLQPDGSLKKVLVPS